MIRPVAWSVAITVPADESVIRNENVSAGSISVSFVTGTVIAARLSPAGIDAVPLCAVKSAAVAVPGEVV